MTLRRRWLPRLILESGLIVFSILLAFSLNGWWQARERRMDAERAIESFVGEIQRNHATLIAGAPYHQNLRRQFAAAQSGSFTTLTELFQSIEGFGGFRPPFLTDAAWQSALVTGVLADLPFETVQELSAVYTLQNNLIRSSHPDRVFSPLLSDENLRGFVSAVIPYLGDVIYGTSELIAAYAGALEYLKGETPAPEAAALSR